MSYAKATRSDVSCHAVTYVVLVDGRKQCEQLSR
jgi:hypothetical protein